MWFFYLFAIVPVLIGGILLLKNKNLIWQEWLAGSAIAFLMAGIMHFIAIRGMTSDHETWSGVITKISHHPEWVERWTKHHSETYYTGSGKDRTSHTRHWTTTEHDYHHEHWVAHRDFGSYNDTSDIDENIFNDLSHKFGGKLFEDGKQSNNHFGGRKTSGDDNIYSVNNEKNYTVPVTINRHFENRIKAAPSLFSFATVPTNVVVHSWPENDDWMHSDRLLGTASLFIDSYKFDCMNSLLGPIKQVNVIMVGFSNEGPEYGQWQQAKWIGGKKNDLVLCFGGATKKQNAQWAYVFGWTENELVKNNLQTILLNNKIDDDILPLISNEIRKNYIIKDWSKFDYISIDPPNWSYWVYILIVCVTQVGLYYHFHNNMFTKSIGRRYKYIKYRY